MPVHKTKRLADGEGFLKGQLLIAMPGMTDRRFVRSVIYMCAHSDEGAMGLIINFPAANINFPDLLERLNIVPRGAEEGIAADLFERQVHTGGPVETGRGFVLHTPDYYVNNSTLRIDTNVSLTASIDILKAIAAGQGPDRAILALGYAGWSPGQIESEMGANGWLHCPADPDLLFDDDLETKYVRALAKMGINPSHLVNAAGTA